MQVGKDIQPEVTISKLSQVPQGCKFFKRIRNLFAICWRGFLYCSNRWIMKKLHDVPRGKEDWIFNESSLKKCDALARSVDKEKVGH